MKRTHFEVVDFLKGYSITTIVLFHLLMQLELPKIAQTAIKFGGAGVHVFVLCSGFGLYLSHIRNPLKYSEFLKRRFLKVYIPYILIILISALFPFMYTGENTETAVLSHVLLFKMFNEQYIDSFGIQFWFISMILQFYLLFPLVVKFYEAFSPKIGLTLAFVLSIAWAIFIALIGKADERIYSSFFLQYFWEFVMGMYFAKVYFTENEITIPRRSVLIGFAFIGITSSGVLGYLGGNFKLFNDIPSLVGYLALALFLYSLKLGYLNRFILYTNKFSYEWYLVHILMIMCLFQVLKGNISDVLICAIALPVSYLIAILYASVVKKTVYKMV